MVMAQEARNLIERIRSRRNKELNGEFGSILTNALEVLSNQLYDTETHFLLELLQNADDNTYDACANPTWTITYRPGSLRIDCNETGFTSSNVEAICTIGGSTKGNRDCVDGFTGEKGLGFKSVFKAADVVWISSNDYSFKFDRREKLGMICPSWATFPGDTPPKATSMFFQLRSDYNEGLLEKQLREFDPVQLLFLRRIRTIHLNVEQRAGPALNKNLQRFDQHRRGHTVTELSMGRKKTTYVVVRRQIQQLPNEPRRQNCTQSELALAFPTVDASAVCECGTQNVYATLPINDYGLKFLLNGDFVLTASRQQIDTSLAWNKALRDNVADAFLAAIDYLDEGPMKDIWPYFVPGPETSPFFEPGWSIVMERLKQRKVLLTFAEKMAEPSELFYIDLTKFADREGIPFTLAPCTEDRYLSPVYGPWIVDTLSEAGLCRLSETNFLVDLGLIISSDQETFCNRPFQWHSELATALMNLQWDSSCWSKIRELPLIPTRSGKWVSASSKPVIIDSEFSVLLSSFKMPEVVETVAMSDINRRALFLRLEVRICQVSELCSYITSAHASSEFHPDNYPPAELISQAKFLFQNSWRPMHMIDIWFATSTDQRCRGSSLYMKEAFQPNSPESRVFDQLSRQFPVMHDDYLAEFKTQRAQDYLNDVLLVSSIPRMVEQKSVDNSDDFRLSNDIKVLFEVCQVSDVLQILCNHWRSYSRWIEKDGKESVSQRRSRLSVVRDIGEIVVQTRAGPCMLQETILSGLDANIEGEVSLPLLDLEVRNGFARQGLKQVGITVEANIDYYLSCLRHVQHEHSLRKEVISYLYQQIQDKCDGHEELVMDFFKINHCVYVELAKPNATERFGWTTIEDCVERKVKLEAQYPTCRYLFRVVLGPQKKRISNLLESSESINLSTGLMNILGIFTGISRAIEAMAPIKATQVVRPLMKKSIMPIRKPGSTLPYHLVTPQDSEWFIADQMYLQVSFHDKIPLLAFSVDEILEIKRLLQCLDLEPRNLSHCVRELTSAREPFKPCDSYERHLRGLVPFIEKLIPSSNTKRETLLLRLRSINVSTAAAVVEQYILEHGSTKVHGRQIEANCYSSFNKMGMRLYLSEVGDLSHQTIFDIADAIAQYCGIKDTQHLRLLYETLGNPDAQSLQTSFARKGIHVSVLGQDTLSKRHRGRTGDILPFPHSFPHPFAHYGDHVGDISNSTGVPTRIRRLSPLEGENGQSSSDRRLPILKLSDGDFDTPGLCYISEKLDPHGELQFIGQNMASRFLEAYLGTIYNPVKHWTSELRTRAGLSRPEICDSQATFTMAGLHTSTEIIDFLCHCGFDRVNRWRGILQTVHFEVVTSESVTGSPFVCSWAQIQRFRRYKLDGLDQCPREVLILLRVKNVYQRPQFEISIDPWDLFCSEEWRIQRDVVLNFLIEDRPLNPVHSRSNSQTATPSRSPQNAVEDGLELSCTTNLETDLPKNLDTGYTEQLIRSTGSSQNMSAAIDMQEWANHDYVYKHLNNGSFRVFILFPGCQGDVLRGEICTIPLTSDRRYRTLSYVWGPENQPTYTIWTPDGILTVKASLNDALLNLRQKSSRMHLWIDAICIDQKNDKEKEHQILLLSRIFQNASLTIAFLGADKKSNDAITTLLQINAKAVCGSDMEEWPKDLPHPTLSWEGRSMPGAESQVWKDVVAFFRRPWFRRAWIIQEAVAAPTVTMVCGGLAFDWNSLYEAMTLVVQKLQISAADAASWHPFMTLGLHRKCEAQQTRYPLAQLLERYRHVHSTLARDRFFALLGLASDGNNQAYAPDYDARFEDIVLKIARAFVAQGRGMTLLNAAGLGSQPDRFPSWIPDWTTTKAASLTDSSSLGVAFNAAGKSQADIRCGEEPNVLAIKGHLVDAITEFSACPNDKQNQREYFCHYESITDVGLLVDSVDGWKFVATKNGLGGMVPGTTMVGDLVCIFNGGDVPFILRRNGMCTDSYRLVGQCLITGIMYGEALASQKTFPQVFHLY